MSRASALLAVTVLTCAVAAPAAGPAAASSAAADRPATVSGQAPYLIRALPTLGEPGSQTVTANARGQIAGLAYDNDGNAWAVRWDPDGSVHGLVRGCGMYFQYPDVKGMTDDGTVFGLQVCWTSASPFVVREDGTSPDLPRPDGADASEATAVHANGDVVGSVRDAISGDWYPVVWRKDGVVEEYRGDDLLAAFGEGTVVHRAGTPGHEDVVVRGPRYASVSLRPQGAASVRLTGKETLPSGLTRLDLDVDGVPAVRYLDPATGAVTERDRAVVTPPPTEPTFGNDDAGAWVQVPGEGRRLLPSLGGSTSVRGRLPDGRLWGDVTRGHENGMQRGVAVVWEPIAGTAQVSVAATADTYVNAKAPRTAYPTASSLAAGGAAQYAALLHFTLPPAPAGRTLVGVRLRVHTSTQSFAGTASALSVSPLGGWTTSTTWATLPTLSDPKFTLGGFGPVAVNAAAQAWLDPVRVTPGEQLDLAISMVDTWGQPVDSMWFWSSEYARVAHRPALDLYYR